MTWPKGYEPPIKESSNSIPEGITCDNCGKFNPLKSKFCNQCGVKIQISCPSCGNKNNLSEANFCNQCGNPMNSEKTNNYENEISTRNHSNNHKLDSGELRVFESIKHNVKMTYPSSWNRKDEREVQEIFRTNPNFNSYSDTFVLFGLSEELQPPSTLAISKQDLEMNISLENYVRGNENDMQVHSKGIHVVESSKTILGDLPAHRTLFKEGEKLISVTFTITENTAYLIHFISNVQEYQKFLPTVEKALNSFQFLVKPPSNNIQNPKRPTVSNGEWFVYTSSEYNIKINYPISWLEYCKPHPIVLVMFKPLNKTISSDFPEALSLSVVELSSNTESLKNAAEKIIRAYEEKDNNFKLLKRKSTKLSGIPAYQLKYILNGRQFLHLLTVKDKRGFQLFYVAKPENYNSYLPIIEKMINTFEFL